MNLIHRKSSYSSSSSIVDRHSPKREDSSDEVAFSLTVQNGVSSVGSSSSSDEVAFRLTVQNRVSSVGSSFSEEELSGSSARTEPNPISTRSKVPGAGKIALTATASGRGVGDRGFFGTFKVRRVLRRFKVLPQRTSTPPKAGKPQQQQRIDNMQART